MIDRAAIYVISGISLQFLVAGSLLSGYGNGKFGTMFLFVLQPQFPVPCFPFLQVGKREQGMEQSVLQLMC